MTVSVSVDNVNSTVSLTELDNIVQLIYLEYLNTYILGIPQ